MKKDSHLRSILKATSWRFFGTLTTTLIVYIFTRRWELALQIGALEVACKIFVFFIHERIWENISLGRNSKNLE